MGLQYFERFYSYVDMGIAVICIMIQIRFVILIDAGEDQVEYNNFRDQMISLRVCIVLGVILMFIKIAYYLSLVDDISPLIDIVFRIFYDIKYFLCILFSTGFAFAYSFYLIA